MVVRLGESLNQDQDLEVEIYKTLLGMLGIASLAVKGEVEREYAETAPPANAVAA